MSKRRPDPRVLVAIVVVLAALARVAWLAHADTSSQTVLQPAPVLGVTIDADMKVLDVEPDSPAERAGVHPGDILETFDTVGLRGRANTAMAKLSAKLRMADTTPGQTLTLRLERDGKTLELEVISTPFRPPPVAPTPVVEPNYYF